METETIYEKLRQEAQEQQDEDLSPDQETRLWDKAWRLSEK